MSLEKILLKINQWGAGAVLIAPALVSSRFIFPFVYLKNLYFRSLVLILLVTLVWYILESGQIALKKHYLLYALIFFGLAATIATVFGVNWQNSLWGNFERMDGLLNWWLLIVYFILLASVFRETNEWLWLFRISLLTAVATAIFGLIKNGWLMYENEWSNLGNSAFLGLYMLLHLILSLVAWLNDKSPIWRYFYIFSLLSGTVVLLGAASRAPIIGLFLGVLVATVLMWRGSGKKYKMVVGGLAIILIIGGGLVWGYRDSMVVKKVKFLNRLTHISKQDATTNSRLLVWQSAWQSFLDRPMLGYGPNNFVYGLNKYYNPRVEEQWFDRAHNFIFDYANAVGVAGLLAYLTIFGAAFYNIYIIRKKDRIQGAVLAGGLTAYLVTLLFVFDTINTWLPALLILAFVGFGGRREEGGRLKFSAVDWGYYPILASVIILSLLGLNFGAVKAAKTNLLAAEAFKYSEADYQKSLSDYREALAVGGIGEREIVLQENRYIFGAIRNEKFDLKAKKAIFEQAEKDSLAVLKRNPSELQVRMALAQTYLAYAQLNTFYIGETINLLQDNIGDSPKRVEIYFMLAQANVLKGDNSGAIGWLERAYEACNEVDSVYENLMLLYARAQDRQKLNQTAQEYINKFPNLSAEQYRKVGQYYFQVGMFDEAERVLREKAIPAGPDKWDGYVSLASIYEQKKEYQKAIEYLNAVLQEHGEWPAEIKQSIDEYINSLQGAQK